MIRSTIARFRHSREVVVGSERRYVARVSLACARGAVAVAARQLDPHDVRSWEFSAFSQNGEDGIVDELLRRVVEPDRYFLEIGASDGLENNSAYLAFVRRYNGLMIEGDRTLCSAAQRHLQNLNVGVDYRAIFVEPHNAEELVATALSRNPDFFSLDIDGNDYHVLGSLLEEGLRPKIICVEYNSAFGPTRAVTIPYTPAFNYHEAHPSHLYYGASVTGWRSLLEGRGYEFVGVESNGVNAFFIDPAQVKLDVPELRRMEYVENFAQRRRFRTNWVAQAKMISSLPLDEVGPSAAG